MRNVAEMSIVAVSAPADRAATYEGTLTLSILLVALLGASGGLLFGCASAVPPTSSSPTSYVIHGTAVLRVASLSVRGGTNLCARRRASRTRASSAPLTILPVGPNRGVLSSHGQQQSVHPDMSGPKCE